MTIEEIKSKLVTVFSQPLKPYRKRIVVFWEDPNQEFIDSIGELAIDGVTILRLDDRHLFAAKELLNDESTGNILVYDPMNLEPKDDWVLDARLYSDALMNFDFYSMVMGEIGAIETPQIRDAVRSYKKFWQSEERVKKFKSLCPNPDKSTVIHLAVMAALVGAKSINPTDILFHLFKEGTDPKENRGLKAVETYGNIQHLWKVVGKYAGDFHENLENALNTIFITALYGTLGSNVPSVISGWVCHPSLSEAQSLITDWMNNHLYREEVALWIKDCEKRLKISELFNNLALEELLTSDLFPSINEAILRKAFEAVSNGGMQGDKAKNIVDERKLKLWYGEYKNYFECLYAMGCLFERKKEFGNSFAAATPIKMWDAYRKQYYKADSDYRHIHYYYSLTTLDSIESIQDKLVSSLDYVEDLYKNWFLNPINDEWLKLVAEPLKNDGRINANIRHASDFFDKEIEDRIDEKLTFVIISDGMRYEIANELSERLALSVKGNVETRAMQSVFPAITKYGMPALLPGKKMVDSTYHVTIGGMPAGNLNERRAVLQSRISEADAIPFSMLLNETTATLKEFVKGKKLIYVYHDQIDGAGHDSSGDSKVFVEAENTIQRIINVVKRICGVRPSCRIFITSDHGFIYTYKALSEAEKFSFKHEDIVDALGEKRCFVAKNPVDSDYLLSVRMVINNETNGLIGYAPLQTIRLKAFGGASNYVHGGLSLEEMMVPVVDFDSVRTDSKGYESNKDKYDHAPVVIKLVTDVTKLIVTNVYSLKFYQEKPIGLDATEAKYQVYIEDVNGNKVSDIGMISADKTDADASNRTFDVLLNLKPRKYEQKEIHYLVVINADTGAMLIKESVSIDGDFSDDFGF